jgi:rhodanese-related sulfurtransferase
MKNSIVALVASILFLASCAGFSTAGDRVEKISVADLREALSEPGLKIIDVRDPRSWTTSTEKIPGAIREQADAVPMWLPKYGKAERIVLYCA